MCTALSLTSKQGDVIFGRTMDFSYELDPEVFIVPRDYTLKSMIKTKLFQTFYQFIGTGQNIGQVVFSDGMNEHGLGVAVLYFPGYAVYDEPQDSSKASLASLDVVAYLLGRCKNIDDVIQCFTTHKIIGVEDPITHTIAPLHWFVCDKEGHSITIEKTNNGVEIYENRVGVLANSPNFSWHMTNLRNYINISPEQLEKVKWGEFLLTPFGQGAGTFGLPGDYTSPSRFVRTVFQKSFISLPETSVETVLTAFHLLDTVSIPKGVVLTQRQTPDYTQYKVMMNLNTGDYYFQTYYHPQVKSFSFMKETVTECQSLGKIKQPFKF